MPNFKPGRRKANATGRNDKERFIALTYDMMKSAAWRSLGGSAVKVYIELRSRFNGGNNGELFLGLSECKLLRLGKDAVNSALKELAAKGFIEMNVKGEFYHRRATTWFITERPKVKGGIPSNDWRKWVGPYIPEKRKRRIGDD